jgi:hypothetical protein
MGLFFKKRKDLEGKRKTLIKGEAKRVEDSNIILLGTGRTVLKQQYY